MARNQLPEGVGKKIVEALKRQAEADITLLDENNNISNSVPLTEINDIPEVPVSLNEEPLQAENDVIIEEEEFSSILPEGVYKEKVEPVQTPDIKEETTPVQNPEANIEEHNEPQLIFHTEEKEQPRTVSNVSFNFEERKKEPVQEPFPAGKVNIPANVLVLKNLISTLPVGVTKQTGAQIIRQTLEAMGLPINNVLKEAQDIQEELNSSTRDCMLKIQEYKTKIMQLEQAVQDYQKNISQINDLVSLFLLTDKK